MRVFLDTGAFLALADADDDYHAAATSVFPTLLRSRARLLTSNFVLSETYTLVRSKVGHRAAVDFMRNFDQAGVRVLRVGTSASSIAPVLP